MLKEPFREAKERQEFQQKLVTLGSKHVNVARHHRVELRDGHLSLILVHVGDTDEALRLLRDSARTQRDPWLLAAEISTADLAHRPARFAKRGLQFIDAEDAPPSHLTELASAVGTLEAGSGLRKNAKKLFRKSLLEPNENSVAQAKWAAQRLGFDEFEDRFLKVPGSFEARALDRVQAGRLSDGVHEAWRWLHDQPFSKTAAMFGSYLASVGLDDYTEATRFISAAEVANPRDALLLNNLAFSYASAGRLADAETALASIPDSLSEPLTATVGATRGLLLFRRGETFAGRVLYLAAVEAFQRLGQKKSSALASIFRAREEILAETGEVDSAMEAARSAYKEIEAAPEITAALQRIEEMYEQKKRDPTQKNRI